MCPADANFHSYTPFFCNHFSNNGNVKAIAPMIHVTPITWKNSSVYTLKPLCDMECNISSSFFVAELTTGKDFSSFSILLINLFGSVQGAFRDNNAVLASADGAGGGGG